MRPRRHIRTREHPFNPDEPTERQIDVLRAVALHGTAKAAARALGICERTVDEHLQQLYRRLGVSSEVEALSAVGWLRLPDLGP